jgi:type II secretory pathway component PulC
MVDLAMTSLKYSAEQIVELNSLMEARKEALKVQDETEEGEIITYNVDDQVYSESDIFTSTNQKFLSANQTAVISEISGDRITIKPEGEKTKMEMSIEEFKKKFKSANTLFSGEETDGPVVDESEGVTQGSTDTVSDLLDGQDAASRQKDLEDQAREEDTRDNLLDDLDC